MTPDAELSACQRENRGENRMSYDGGWRIEYIASRGGFFCIDHEVQAAIASEKPFLLFEALITPLPFTLSMSVVSTVDSW